MTTRNRVKHDTFLRTVERIRTGSCLVLVFSILFVSAKCENESRLVDTFDDSVASRISATIAGLSTEEKIGQLFMPGFHGDVIDRNAIELITRYRITGFVVSKRGSTEASAAIMARLQSLSTIPLLLAADHESGACMRVPSSISLPDNETLGAMNDPSLTYDISRFMARDLKASGININLAPVLDIDNHPSGSYIGRRSFGDTPEIVSNMGIAQLDGFKAGGIIGTVKHFPGHGDTVTDSHLSLPVITQPYERLAEVELLPFRRAIRHGAEIVMVGHLFVPSIDDTFPASLSPVFIRSILRDELGFTGVVVSDSFSMKALTNSYEGGEASRLFIAAGGDIILTNAITLRSERALFVAAYDGIAAAVASGEIAAERIDESLARIMRLKYRIFGDALFDLAHRGD